MMGRLFFCRRWWSGGRGGRLWLGIGGIGRSGRELGTVVELGAFSRRAAILEYSFGWRIFIIL
jgi:hypothetical protein